MTDAPGGTAPSTLPLPALGLGAFGVGTAELAPMGLLPAIAGSLGVPIPAAGQIVTACAAGVMADAPVMTLLLLMALFVLGNFASAAARGYWTLVLARIATSFAQGAFFGFGAVVATSLVAPARRANAVATMFMELSIANILGVPAATWAGDAIGWRAAFAGTAGLGLMALGGIGATLPASGGGSRPDARELGALLRPQMLRTVAATILFAAASSRSIPMPRRSCRRSPAPAPGRSR
ncbi:MFS transporter [Mangrovicoccus sp. HB161399]|uniref:MFS transporter n=1 Tax=Mangrovicoccus sp. HB161399 TaxID=2720392 RepID=UPI00155284EF|nr:MFS transporter [Mangrovicoccus sp. HB161399]